MKTLKYFVLGAFLYTGANNKAHYLNAANVGLLTMASYYNPQVISEVLKTVGIVSALATTGYVIGRRDHDRNLYEIYTLILSCEIVGAMMILAYHGHLCTTFKSFMLTPCSLLAGLYLNHISTYCAIQTAQICSGLILATSVMLSYLREIYHLDDML